MVRRARMNNTLFILSQPIDILIDCEIYRTCSSSIGYNQPKDPPEKCSLVRFRSSHVRARSLTPSAPNQKISWPIRLCIMVTRNRFRPPVKTFGEICQQGDSCSLSQHYASAIPIAVSGYNDVSRPSFLRCRKVS